jgi:hypothetical protein
MPNGQITSVYCEGRKTAFIAPCPGHLTTAVTVPHTGSPGVHFAVGVNHESDCPVRFSARPRWY